MNITATSSMSRYAFLLVFCLVAFSPFALSQPVEVETSNQPAWVTANSLNIRGCPQTSCEVIGKLHRGDQISIEVSSNGWSKIADDSIAKWVSSDYLSFVPIASTTPEALENESDTELGMMGIVGFILGTILGWFIFPYTRSVFTNLSESKLQYLGERLTMAGCCGVVGMWVLAGNI